MRQMALFTLFLTFLSGTFTLSKLNMGISLDVRYIMFLAFVYIFWIGNVYGDKMQVPILNGKLVVFLLITFSYFFFSTLSLYYTIDQYYSVGKFGSLIFLNIILISLVIMVTQMESAEFYQSISLFFIVFAVVYTLPIYLDVLSGAARGNNAISGPNVTTRILFFGMICALYRFSLNHKVIYFVLSILFFGGIVLVGSRGGLLGATVTLLILLIINKLAAMPKSRENILPNYKKLFLFFIGAAVFYFIYEPLQKVFMNRIIGTTFENDEIYISGRESYYSAALSMIEEKPLVGYGINSFSAHTGRIYPHNLFLEMTVEVGMIGAGIFLAFLIFSAWLLIKLRTSQLFIFSGLPLYMILVHMSSGEFYDFRYFFFWIIPLLYYGIGNSSELLSNYLKRNPQTHKRSIESN